MDIYLSKPGSCDVGAADANDGNKRPVISVFYAYNVAPSFGLAVGGEVIPTTNAELAAGYCPQPVERLPVGISLLGSPAAGCVRRTGAKIALIAASLYDQEPAAKGDPPDSQVMVELDTTADRLNLDLKDFSLVVRSMTVCAARWQPAALGRPRCPPMVAW